MTQSGALWGLLLTASLVSGQEDQLATADSSRVDTVVSPDALAKLLATATGAIAAGVSTPLVFPLAPSAPNKFRNKRKPQNRFRPNGESRFRPRSKLPTSPPGPLSPQFSGFARRPRPESEQQQPTGLPFLEPEPVEPLVLTNHISEVVDREKEQEALLEKLRSQASLITGAQPVGVTRDIRPADHRTRDSRPEDNQIRDTRPADSQIRDTRPADNQIRDTRPLGDLANRRDYARQLSPEQTRQTQGSRRVQGGLRREEGGFDYYEEEEQVREVVRQEVRQQPRRKTRPRAKSSGGQKGSVGGRRKDKVGTIERYRFTNEDGSITWGYENEDGSFKEETIGIDCVTHGKYGYIDPAGEVREYSYTSGNRCDPDTRQVETVSNEQTGARGPNGHGFYDYGQNKFVMSDGRRVRVVVNQRNKARGQRY